MHKLLFALIALGCMLSLTATAGDEIYRVVDENGNVIYTDQKPEDDADPLALPELNVLEGDSEGLPVVSRDGQLDPVEQKSMGFQIDRPADGEAITPANGMLQVTMEIAIDIPPTAEIVLVLDGEELEPVRSLEVSVPAPPPGEHELVAHLRTPAGRVLGTTETVHFTTVAAAGD